MSVLYARFDVAILRDPRVVKCGPLPRLLYFQIILYCRENLTDGVVEKSLLSYVSKDIPKPKVQISKLVEVGLLEEAETLWRIPIEKWRKWNPLKAEVEQKRAEEAQRKADYRNRKSGDVPSGQVRTDSTRDAQPEPEPEPEEKPEPYEKDSPHNLELVHGGPADDDVLVAKIASELATLLTEQANTTDPHAYRETCLTQILRDELDGIRTMLRKSPHYAGNPRKAADWYEANRERRAS